MWQCSLPASPGRRLNRAQHLAKFRRCWTFSAAPLKPGAADTLIAVTDRLEDVMDAGRWRMLVP
jgi:aconitate decarboxylase